MKLDCFAVYDSKIQAFAQPFFLRSKGEALRSFTEACNDPNTNLFKFGTDFSLMHIAEYDDATGTFQNLKAPENLGLAESFKTVTQNESVTNINSLREAK